MDTELAGSVIEGTMITEDLLNAFLPILEEYDSAVIREARVALRYLSLANAAEDFAAINRAEEYASDILNEKVWDAMNDIAPDGYYFGAHIGDGSDYGFWPLEWIYDV